MSILVAFVSPPRRGIPLLRPPSAKLGPRGRLQLVCVSASLELTFECSLVVAVIAVRALYAGTLAPLWTTAPSLPQRPLAALCLLATLTIAARCYASSNATHPLVQFSPTPSSSLSPIDNSNARPHSSTLVLSRLLSPPRPVQSDTSVIVINSKKLLHNQNSNETKTTRRKKPISARTKRELYASKYYNRIFEQTKRTSAEKSNEEKRANVLVTSETDNSVSDSDRVNYTTVNTAPENEHQNDSSFLDQEDAPAAHSEGTERPMPPVHDHGNASLSDWGILVLVLSAIVLTVALGLITCVLSHYRPVTAGEGAADGGTAAHPHDAARTPTTAPTFAAAHLIAVTTERSSMTVLFEKNNGAKFQSSFADSFIKRAVRKCLTVMRQKLTINRKMLSVVSAGAAAGVGGMDRLRGGRAARELAATRDRQVRLHAVHTDIAINLPPNIAMPDGEEQHPFTSSRLHIRDPEQESEIHQKCIRPPPNRTVLESESPPPYRSSSAGLLGSSSSSSSSGGGGEWSGGGGAPLVVRCHSMSSSSSSTATTKRPEAGSSGQKTDFLHRTVKIFTGGKKGAGATPTPPPVHTTLPVVIVPTRPRRTSTDHQQQQQQQQQGPRPKPSV
ncbi:hypothetical protein TcasGA2_TC031022 [Tribolium castaneum]|uniref:Uncharacterized protein n=1 Tax=Tribolium castaneum TaxID=7070 RepID=A0A139WM53_TRICA|nr:hypothetical protein TcasGA2_TC031022 [Tribolium castaneum]